MNRLRRHGLRSARQRESHCARGHSKQKMYLCSHQPALVAKLVDAPDLGSGGFGRVGSSPIKCTRAPHANRFPTAGARGPLRASAAPSARCTTQTTPYLYIYAPRSRPPKGFAPSCLQRGGFPGRGNIKPLPFFFPLVCAIFAPHKILIYITLCNIRSMRSSLTSQNNGYGEQQNATD